jgi:uncharacterized protein (TIGR02646 family)
MRFIAKSQSEPQALVEYRVASRNINYTWSNFRKPYKDDYRAYLLNEQGHICAYCMQRITNSETKIEHLKPRHSCCETEKLSDTNMVAVCKGFTDIYKHCDTFRGNLRPVAKHIMKLSPLMQNPNCEELISIIDGVLKSSDPTIDRELSEKLNLNCKGLIEKRQRAEQGYIEALIESEITWSIDLYKIELHLLLQIGVPFENRHFEEFCLVKINVIRDKIAL